MNGNNGHKSRQNWPVNKMERAPTRHQPERASRVRASVMAAAQAAPLHLPGPVHVTRKVSRSKKENNSNKKRVAYAIGSKKSRTRANNNLSLNGLSFGNSSFTMKNFINNRAAESYAPSAAASAFVPKNEQRAFQIKMKKSISKQHAANKQRLANIAERKRLGHIKGRATRKANKEALLAAQAAAAAAMEEVREAEQVVVAQGQSSAGVSTHARQALAHAREAQRTALDEYTALQHALEEVGMTASSSNAANYTNENKGSAHANNGSASAASSESPANFFGRFKP